MRTVSRLSPKHRASVRGATARINIWHGSVRSGKTVAANVRWLQFVRDAPPGTLAMLGKTTTTLRHNVIGPLYDMLGPSRMRVWPSKGEAEILGRFIRLLGANDERAEAKIRGDTFAGAYGDELTLWPPNMFGMLLSRLSVRGAKFFGSTNPDSPNHWLKVNWLDREDALNLRSFHFGLRDNPYLDGDFVDALEAEYTGLWRKRFIDGLWVIAEGAIWDNFDSDKHVIAALPDGVDILETWVACDYGTTNPFVALLFGTGSDGVTYVLDEWRWDSRARGRQKTDPEYSAELGEWIGARSPVAWYPDPSAASFILQLRRDHDWAVHNADHDVLDGIRFVAKMLGQGRLRILQCCAGLVGEIESYVWDQKAQERGEDKPIKQNDHGPDALRYGLYSHLAKQYSLADYGWVA